MLLFSATRISSSLGTTVPAHIISNTGRLTRKQSMGVWSLELKVMATTMRELPQSAVVQRPRRSTKKRT